MKQKDSIFTKIIKKEIPGVFVYEDEMCVCVVDKFPEVEGKVLVIPRKQVDYIVDLDNETYQHLFAVAKKISKALDAAFEAERTVMLVEGFEVPHVHIKLYPIKKDQVEHISHLLHNGSEISDKQAKTVAEKIKHHLT